jgi:hypothetical protein
VSPQLVADWIAVRKAKRAGPLTETVITGLGREADKAGISVEQAVRHCCEAGWAGFKAEWFSARASQRRAAPAGRYAAAAATVFGGTPAGERRPREAGDIVNAEARVVG